MKKVFALTIALLLSACGNRITAAELAGAGLGMMAGGAIGYQIGGGVGQWVATSIGATLGGGVGYVGGRLLTMTDLSEHRKTAAMALNQAGDGEYLSWSNPESGHRGIFRPTRSFHARDGRFCRDYRATVVLESGIRTGEGTACRQADGLWTPVTEQFG